jgi:predicted transposase/invertase (TIGR01784 family)
MHDNICKFLVENFPGDLTSWLVDQAVTLTEIKPQELSLEPIRADALILQKAKDFILHAEFQTNPDRQIPFRMLDYRLRCYRRYPNYAVKQIVIYLRPSNSPLVYQDRFEMEETQHRFQVMRLWEQPTEIFFRSPGLLPFASISKTDNPAATLAAVNQELIKIEDRTTKSNLMAASSVLAGINLDKNLIKQILRSDIMKESVIYQDILEEGISQGISQGEQQEREAIAAKTIPLFLSLGLTPEEIAQKAGFDLSLVQRMINRSDGDTQP